MSLGEAAASACPLRLQPGLLLCCRKSWGPSQKGSSTHQRRQQQRQTHQRALLLLLVLSPAGAAPSVCQQQPRPGQLLSCRRSWARQKQQRVCKTQQALLHRRITLWRNSSTHHYHHQQHQQQSITLVPLLFVLPARVASRLPGMSRHHRQQQQQQRVQQQVQRACPTARCCRPGGSLGASRCGCLGHLWAVGRCCLDPLLLLLTALTAQLTGRLLTCLWRLMSWPALTGWSERQSSRGGWLAALTLQPQA